MSLTSRTIAGLAVVLSLFAISAEAVPVTPVINVQPAHVTPAPAVVVQVPNLQVRAWTRMHPM
ncbi:hypothetical protein BC835DRAFT_1422732 [Cytidiella melzeri]|nr:hypothetical protein BC835DRAFT_1422732 [Cytidiella melzeri]